MSINSHPACPFATISLGCVPQCGFSVAAANLYAGKIITIGTLIAVFISTSDEAIPLLLSNPESGMVILKLLLIKVIIATLFGIIIDFIERKNKHVAEPSDFAEICTHCGCEHGILKSAIKHTLNIFIFILFLSVGLNIVTELIGMENLSKILLTDSIFQPFLSALIGFIPNCSASILLTELYIEGTLSFGSVIAGLCTGAGVGIAVLFRTNKSMKDNFKIVFYLYFIAVISGTAIHLLGI